MKFKKLILLLPAFGLLLFTSCEKDVTDPDNTGQLNIEMTDAPIDDADVGAAFITISDIKIDGNSVDGFNKTTFDIKSFQKGNTKLLSTSEIDADSYSSVTFVFDYDQDESGNTPGSYIQKTDGTKEKMETSANEFTLYKDFSIENNGQTDIIIDFDLRKAIRKNDQDPDDYEFVTSAEFESALRITKEDETGTITGNCNDLLADADAVIVYAYKKGDYTRSNEISGHGSSDIQFANAVTSSMIDVNGDYELHFLEEGEYELHYASYNENPEGEMELSGTLILDIITGIDIGSISVDASTNVNVNVVATGILPL